MAVEASGLLTLFCSERQTNGRSREVTSTQLTCNLEAATPRCGAASSSSANQQTLAAHFRVQFGNVKTVVVQSEF